MRDFSTLGDKLGPKIAQLVSQSVVATRRALGPHEVRVRRQATQDVIDQAGREVAEHYRPLIRKILDADHVQIDEDVRLLLADSISGEHQLKAIGGLLLGPAGGTIGTFISNLLAPVLYTAIRSAPQLHVDTQTAAQGGAQRGFSDADGADKASGNGIDNGQVAELVVIGLAYPSIADALDLLRRGKISHNQFNLCLEPNAVPPQFIGPLGDTREVPLPADLAALAVLRSVITKAEGEKIAALTGVSKADFAIMIEDTGEPPGLEQLEEAYRRNIIDKARLHRGILQSRIRNEWIDVIDALRFAPMSVADAVNAVVQNHLPASAAAAIAEGNGLQPGASDTLIQSACSSLSPTQPEHPRNLRQICRATRQRGR